MKCQFGPFSPISGLMVSPRKVKTSKFWDSGFKNEMLHLKFPFVIVIPFVIEFKSFYCCLVAIYYFEIVLKNVEKWRHKRITFSHLSLSILQNFCCTFSVLKQWSSIGTNFHNDWLKTWPDIRKLVFLLNEELYRKFAAVLKVWQRWRYK